VLFIVTAVGIQNQRPSAHGPALVPEEFVLIFIPGTKRRKKYINWFLCGGGLEHLHRSPESRKMRWEGNPVPGGIIGPPCHHQSIYGSTALVDLGRFFSFLIYTQSVGLLRRGISSSQGRYLHTEQHKHRINAQTSMPWVGFKPTIPVFERVKTRTKRSHKIMLWDN
jgi:hypothetical protein